MANDHTQTGDITIEVHLNEAQEIELEMIRRGLSSQPRRISSRFFYDDHGSHLFERICEVPEYYQTRTEEGILRHRAREIVATTGARELVELGSGAATKTRVILDAMEEAGTLRRYIPFDVNESIVRRTAAELTELYPGLQVHGVTGDFVKHLPEIPDGDHRLFIFLGGTIGNFSPEQAHRFVTEIHDSMQEGDHFLLGTDLIKDPAVLNAAYNDSEGLTAEFNLNMLRVVNRIAGGDFDLESFEHDAFYNEELTRIEMWLRSVKDQTVRLDALDVTLDLAADERILTEISTKFDRQSVERLLGSAGMVLEHFHTDPGRLFGISIARSAL